MSHTSWARSPFAAATLVCAMTVLGSCVGDEEHVGFQKAVLRVFTEGSGSGTVDFGGVGSGCDAAERGGATFCTAFPDAGGGGSVTVTAVPDAGSVFVAWGGCESTSGASCVMAFDATPATVEATVRFDLEAENSCPNITVPAFSSLGLKTGPRPGAATPVPDNPAAWAGTNYLTDADFEGALVFAGGIPTGTGYWAFDQAWSAPTGQQGITAQDGSRMLHFVSSSRDGTATATGTASEQIQLVDVSALRTRIDAGQVEVEASAFFNRVAAEGCTRIDNAFGIRVSAHAGIPTDVNVDLGFDQGNVTADDDPGGWQVGTATLVLPTGTTHVAVRLFINEGTANNDPVYPEFHGHYADNANLSIRLR